MKTEISILASVSKKCRCSGARSKPLHTLKAFQLCCNFCIYYRKAKPIYLQGKFAGVISHVSSVIFLETTENVPSLQCKVIFTEIISKLMPFMLILMFCMSHSQHRLYFSYIATCSKYSGQLF